jgi:hypothetical protein
MRVVALLLAFVVHPGLAAAEEAWRWTDAHGTLWYTNRPDVAPADAELVTTHLQIVAARLPDSGDTIAVAHEKPAMPPAKRPRQVYTEARRRFGCYAAGVLFAGGWSHADDISGVGNCLPYLLGPEAWLNSARAELAMREHGIDWRDVVRMYFAERGVEPAPSPTSFFVPVSDRP